MKQVTCTLTLSVVIECDNSLSEDDVKNLITKKASIDIEVNDRKVYITEVSDIVDITEVKV